MVAGVPIGATDVGACQEVLALGRCGWLVEPGRAVAMADGNRAVPSEPKGAQQRADAARLRAFREFSVAAMAEAYGYELGLR